MHPNPIPRYLVSPIAWASFATPLYVRYSSWSEQDIRQPAYQSVLSPHNALIFTVVAHFEDTVFHIALTTDSACYLEIGELRTLCLLYSKVFRELKHLEYGCSHSCSSFEVCMMLHQLVEEPFVILVVQESGLRYSLHASPSR